EAHTTSCINPLAHLAPATQDKSCIRAEFCHTLHPSSAWTSRQPHPSRRLSSLEQSATCSNGTTSRSTDISLRSSPSCSSRRPILLCPSLPPSECLRSGSWLARSERSCSAIGGTPLAAATRWLGRSC